MLDLSGLKVIVIVEHVKDNKRSVQGYAEASEGGLTSQGQAVGCRLACHKAADQLFTQLKASLAESQAQIDSGKNVVRDSEKKKGGKKNA